MEAYIFLDTDGQTEPRRVLARNIDEAWRKYLADVLWPASHRANMTHQQLREEFAHGTIVIMEKDIKQVS